MKTYHFTGLSPLLFGSGLPFGTDPGSLDAETLIQPMPSTFAGAIRSEIARRNGWTDFSHEYKSALEEIAIRGPLFALNNKLVFAAPLDAVMVEQGGQSTLVHLKPTNRLGGTNLPPDLSPCVLPAGEFQPSKASVPSYWELGDFVKWLADETPQVTGVPIETETRIHVGIDPSRRAAQEGMLFTTEGVCTGHTDLGNLTLAAQIDDRASVDLSGAITLGGERRIAQVNVTSASLFDPPPGYQVRGSRIKLTLATPGYFDGGWRPSKELLESYGLILRGACVGRKVSLSGWDPFSSASKIGGPKPLKWLVPAGSTFFFEGDVSRDYLSYWLQPFGDEEQLNLNGFGLALWGTW